MRATRKQCRCCPLDMLLCTHLHLRTLLLPAQRSRLLRCFFCSLGCCAVPRRGRPSAFDLAPRRCWPRCSFSWTRRRCFRAMARLPLEGATCRPCMRRPKRTRR